MQTANMLAGEQNHTGSTLVVRSREGDYALVLIDAASDTQLEIEYEYPYGSLPEVTCPGLKS